MTLIDLLAAASGAPTRLDPVKLFLDADIVVQVVMAGLIIASIWVWTIILSFAVRMAGVRKRCDAYEAEFLGKTKESRSLPGRTRQGRCALGPRGRRGAGRMAPLARRAQI